MSAATAGSVEFKGATLSFVDGGRRVEAVRNLTLRIDAGEFFCVVGPSGCGKSTLLKSIAGYHRPEKGEILVDGQVRTEPGPDRGMVAQQHTLFPWRTALDNVCFGPKMRGVGAAERREAGRRMLAEMGLAGFEDCYPAQLSGGMQQRVEIARALINEPKVLLLDEPFSALDAETRRVMQELVLSIWQARRVTVVFVTHDIDEALFLADRVLVLSRRPSEVRAELPVAYERPRTLDILASADFVAIKRRCLELVREGSALGGSELQSSRIGEKFALG
ncbi:ABC transporter ATP-binding protein [Pendulispora albinea]|uniref:ABC transporter ATP-binding protein n=1 Tax=Pendulispora albinea TaxID=2741071 RepID=A0ABZ2LTV8_9BACT